MKATKKVWEMTESLKKETDHDLETPKNDQCSFTMSLLLLIGIITVETIFISIILFVIIKFYRKRSNNLNNQPPIPGNVNLNLAEYAQPRDFFRVSTDSHFYAEVGNGLKKGESVYEEVDKSKR
jgi:hypothetical protein